MASIRTIIIILSIRQVILVFVCVCTHFSPLFHLYTGINPEYLAGVVLSSFEDNHKLGMDKNKLGMDKNFKHH